MGNGENFIRPRASNRATVPSSYQYDPGGWLLFDARALLG